MYHFKISVTSCNFVGKNETRQAEKQDLVLLAISSSNHTYIAIKIKNYMGRSEVYLRRQTVTKNIDNIRKILLVFQDASFLEEVLTIED